jgi:uncharacterized membrane protein
MERPHSHHASVRASPRLRRNLAFAVVPFVVATAVGLVLLRPTGELPETPFAGPPPEIFAATVLQTEETECEGLPVEGFRCWIVQAWLEEGPDAEEVVTLDLAGGAGTRHVSEGDGILVGFSPESPPEQQYYFVDYDRASPLIWLALLFGAMVIALSRWRGLAALAGLGVTFVILLMFILPAILEGRSPLAVAIVGAAAIMFVTLYLAHGLNVKTTTAILGTLASLTLTGLLAFLFIQLSRFTGLGSEEAAFLQVSAAQVNLQGLLLAGIIIGALGVMDDVTVTQASAVWELHVANPRYGPKDLFNSALRIGRDHIAATVNTLVLAYAGAAMPLLILFSLTDQAMSELLTREVIAEEIVRTLVGSIGLVASVPITTGLAALVVTADRRPAAAARTRAPAPEPELGLEVEGPEAKPEGTRRPPAEPEGMVEEDWARPKAEREWREGL